MSTPDNLAAWRRAGAAPAPSAAAASCSSALFSASSRRARASLAAWCSAAICFCLAVTWRSLRCRCCSFLRAAARCSLTRCMACSPRFLESSSDAATPANMASTAARTGGGVYSVQTPNRPRPARGRPGVAVRPV